MPRYRIIATVVADSAQQAEDAITEGVVLSGTIELVDVDVRPVPMNE